MKFEIKNWITGVVMFGIEGESFKLAFKAAAESGQNFKSALIKNQDLSGIEIKFSRFEDSRFVDSRFVDSRFVDSSFLGSRFVDSSFVDSRFVDSRFVDSSFLGSRFVDSSFEGSRFVDSRFVDSSFVDSSFLGSRFEGSRFERTEIPKEYLTQIRDDIWAVLSALPKEAEGIRLALIEGRVNGTQYQGNCACLIGTAANIRHCDYRKFETIKPNARRDSEQWFTNIKPGDTVESSIYTKFAVECIDEWLANMKSAFGVK